MSKYMILHIPTGLWLCKYTMLESDLTPDYKLYYYNNEIAILNNDPTAICDNEKDASLWLDRLFATDEYRFITDYVKKINLVVTKAEFLVVAYE